MRDVLTLKVAGKLESEFVYRFQQFTSPVMAKGVEDTAFYCYNRLTALNEVGGDPDCGDASIEAFHTYNAAVQQSFPATLTTLSTHDTKRSDDVRARLLVLCEDPDAFAEFASKLLFDTRYLRPEIVDGATQWFFYQTLVGAWPIDAERLKAYMQKAMREAKVRTSWVSNNAEYESALNDWIDAMLSDPESIADIESYVSTIRDAGRINSLSQTLLKYTAPGVPDLYQGGELWDLSLVDPDNRRPVDYVLRARLLQQLSSMTAGEVMARADEGLPKLWVIHHALCLRQQHPEWFGADAAYTPVSASGAACERVIAALRGDSVLTVAQRWPQRGVAWDRTTLRVPEGRWRSVLCGCEVSGGDVAVSALLGAFPVALLARI